MIVANFFRTVVAFYVRTKKSHCDLAAYQLQPLALCYLNTKLGYASRRSAQPVLVFVDSGNS
tara:strand:+ start:368 stop:553 length:186 start_codon:yes stop_codon:yes gene_type:complete